jgi:outer membrane receptor protein involved in Fe transport
MNNYPNRTMPLFRLSLGLVALAAAVPASLRAQQPPTSTAPVTSDATATNDTSASQAAAVTLDPFTVTTSKDKGYAATNEISGSRVDTAIKDIPIPIEVITSEFISDIGATDLRGSLLYSGVMLNTQNDLENSGGTYGSPYGPGGVNNPQGLTSNINQVQLKIRGFVTDNTLRDGFLRGSSTDSVNIDRIEVVSGPNALLYGTGNFGGVVDYLIKTPQDTQQGAVTISAGTYGFLRTAVDLTGPISAANHLDYRIAGSYEQEDSQIDYQKFSHVFLAPSVEWKPFSGTALLLDTEYGRSRANGVSFQALRAVEGNSATPTNNDQIEAVAFYFPPGANPRTFNLSGPDTYDDQQESNVEIKLTQRILKESEWLPSLDFLIGYNRSYWATQTRNLNAEITGPILAGNPGYSLAQTITTSEVANSIDGQGSNNGNLIFGTLPAAVDQYSWYENQANTTRDQERVEFTAGKTLWDGHWYKFQDQALAGYSELKNTIEQANEETDPGVYSYKKPTDLNPIVFGHQGDGSPDPAMFTNDYNNENVGWDAGYYFNDYAKLLNDRVILMSGIRRDKNDNWSTDTQVTGPGANPTTTTGRGATDISKSYQNGVIIEITKHLSVYGLKSEGIEPNFGGLHNAVTGAPVGSDYAKSRELGIKFDFLDGKISGTISHYKITKTSWVAEPWYAPAPLGHPRFNPNADIVYELSGGFNANGQPGTTTTFAGIGSQGAPIQNQPQVVAAWNAAVAAGAVYTLASEPGRLYLDASKPTGAAYLDAAFAANQASGGAWPGWLYQGDSNEDPNINNATEDAGGFYNGSQDPAWQVIDQSKGWDGQILFSPTNYLQFVLHGNFDAAVNRTNLGQWPEYPYPQDRWAVWYFQNGGFGLDGQPLSVAYTNPANTATRTNAGVFPGDDTPKYQYDFWMNYKFSGELRGMSVGLGGEWHSQEEFFSGVTHGGQNIEQNAAGQTIIAYSPSETTVNLELKYEWRKWGHGQYVQLNVNNLLDDRKLYGLVYNTPLTAKISYGFGF